MMIITSIVALVVASTLLYRRVMHPLNDVPGPMLAKVSSIWIALNSLRMRRAQSLSTAHRKYGSMIRVAPNELSFSDPAVYREIYGKSKSIVKSADFYEPTALSSHSNIFSMSNVAQHASRRRMESRAFAQSSMMNIVDGIVSKASQLTTALQKIGENGKHADLFAWFHMFAFEVIFLMAFNRDANLLHKGEIHPVQQNMEDIKLSLVLNGLFPGIRHYGQFLPGIFGKPYRAIRYWRAFSLNILEEDRSRKDKASFMQQLRETEDEFLGRKLSDQEVLEEVMAMMFAGSGTTASTLVYLAYSLGTNLESQKKLYDELITAQPDPGTPNYEIVKSLPYLNACIKETLRLYPTIVSTLPRTVLRDIQIEGYRVPAGTKIGMSNFVHQRDPSTFAAPDTFLPERWLDISSEQLAKQNIAFTPFSQGPRNCIGQNLAMMELILGASALFRDLEFVVDGTTEDDMQINDTFNGACASGKLIVLVQPRG